MLRKRMLFICRKGDPYLYGLTNIHRFQPFQFSTLQNLEFPAQYFLDLFLIPLELFKAVKYSSTFIF
jgi:hypothetical protein